MLDIRGVEASGIMFAPTAVRPLLVHEPLCSAPKVFIRARSTCGPQRRAREPGRVGEVAPPTPGPGPARTLPASQPGAAGCNRLVAPLAVSIRMLIAEGAQPHHRRCRAFNVGELGH